MAIDPPPKKGAQYSQGIESKVYKRAPYTQQGGTASQGAAARTPAEKEGGGARRAPSMHMHTCKHMRRQQGQGARQGQQSEVRRFDARAYAKVCAAPRPTGVNGCQGEVPTPRAETNPATRNENSWTQLQAPRKEEQAHTQSPKQAAAAKPGSQPRRPPRA